jgi:hypothetical protein
MDIHAIAEDFRANPITSWVVKEVYSGIVLGKIRLGDTGFVTILTHGDREIEIDRFEDFYTARDSFTVVPHYLN